MPVKTLWILILTLSFLKPNASAQSTPQYAKVKINLENKKIEELTRLGVETDHGQHAPGRYLINDYSIDEITIIKNAGFTVEILISDVEKYYANPNRPSAYTGVETRDVACDFTSDNTFNFSNPLEYIDGSMAGYHTYQEMLSMLDRMRDLYPSLISTNYVIDSIPTHMGNRIFYIRVSNEPYQYNPNKPQVLYTALHHAREPNSLSQMLFYMWYLFENYGTDPLVTKLLNETQMIFVPCINPDGYIINQTNLPQGGGLWRKNGWTNDNGEQKGVDLNRNYGYFWGFDDNGSSSNEDSQVFRGVAAFSEPETRAIRAICETFDFITALNYHSFGNLLIHPWGYNSTPTAEDALFKSMGKTMIRDNQFKMGTAIETVGYIVNGSSDDWMYGENSNRNPTYSFTPEVGYSFWPAPSDINRINRSAVWLNIFAALVTTSYYDVQAEKTWSYLTSDKQYVDVVVRRVGLQQGSVNIRLESNTPGVQVITPGKVVSLAQGQQERIRFLVDVDENLNYPNGVIFELISEQNGFNENSTLRFQYVPGELSRIFYHSLDNDEHLYSSGFVRFEDDYYSPPASFKESEFAFTPVNYSSELRLTKAIDLSDTKAAYFQFFTKWDLEKNYDYAVVEASTDSLDFTPLCGLYTKEGTLSQIEAQPVYDGIQKEWVREQVDLTSLIGQKKVWLRFRVQTDEFNSGTGFLVDDLEIIKVSGSLTTRDEPKLPAWVKSSLSDGVTPLEIMTHDHGVLFFQIHNNQGTRVYDGEVEQGQIHLESTNLPAGLYFYTIWNELKTKKNTGKLLIIR